MNELTELARRLVSIDSVNPDLVPGGAGEREIAKFVADWLRGGRARGGDRGVGVRAPQRCRRRPGHGGGVR
jgi:acetylornithine deacetylase/succinyl-diaminopimelate desuccinylase-like protein